MSYMHRPLPKKADFGGAKVEFMDTGEGKPLLYLHAVDGVHEDLPFIRDLASSFRVVAASHPGFGGSELPKGCTTVDDLAYFYLDLMDKLDLRDVVLVGSSFGGWIAAEIAIKSCERLSKIVLAGSMGIKVSRHDERAIADYFQISIPELPSFLFHDEKRGLEAFNQFDFAAMREEEVNYFTRNRDSYALFNWSPHGYNPKLLGRLHRIGVPSLLLWGENDRVTPLSYGQAFAKAIPGARFQSFENCGHYPHIEASGRFANAIREFAAR